VDEVFSEEHISKGVKRQIDIFFFFVFTNNEQRLKLGGS